MKLHGYLRGSGRLGNIVCARVGRETIAKTHNPKKANPNTEKQVNERSRFKLITQLAASYAPVIAIPKEGNQSKRNRFVRRNYDILHAENGQASIDLTQIQLTAGSIGLPDIVINPNATQGLVNVELSEGVRDTFSRIVYIGFVVDSSNVLSLKASTIQENGGEDRTFPATLNIGSTKGIVYAYGIKDQDEQLTAKYGSWNVSTAEDIARLVVRRAMESTYYRMSRTKGATYDFGDIYNITWRIIIGAGNLIWEETFKGIYPEKVLFTSARTYSPRIFTDIITDELSIVYYDDYKTLGGQETEYFFTFNNGEYSFPKDKDPYTYYPVKILYKGYKLIEFDRA